MRVEDSRNYLPPRLTYASAWDNPKLLKAYQDSYRSNAEEWDALTSKTAQYIILGLSSIPAVSAAVKGSRIPAALLGIAGIEGPSYIESQRDWNRANEIGRASCRERVCQ